jgi:hypothetical protein
VDKSEKRKKFSLLIINPFGESKDNEHEINLKVKDALEDLGADGSITL